MRWLVGLMMALAVSAADTERGITVIPITTVAPGGNAGLFVGVNVFSKDASLRPLSFAVNDAIAQAHLFVVELKLLPSSNVHLALSGQPSGELSKTQLEVLTKIGVRRTDATKTDILSSLFSIRNAAQEPSDLVVISISSHGFEERGVAYVLPSDGLRDALEDTGLNLTGVEQRLAQSKAGKRLLLIDACREQPVTDTKSIGGMMSSAFRSALAAAEGQAVLASCDAGQLSVENQKLEHGLFSYFLLKALRGEAAADSRGYITLGSVSDYVARSVRDWASRNKPAADQRTTQQPWFKGPKIAEQIPLAVDPGVRARLGAFKQGVVTTISALRSKISRNSEFTTAVYDRLADALEQAQDDDAGRKLLERSKEFVTGKLVEDVFIAYLERILGRPAQRPAIEPTPTTTPTPMINPTPMIEPKPIVAPPPAIVVKTGDIKTIDLGNGAKLELVWVAPGGFMMGASDGSDNEKPLHQVRITKGFWLGRCEVTQQQYESVMGTNPSRFKSAQNPVEQVNWEDAVAFCRKIRARLPTEAEWEYACRAGTSTKFSSGDTDSDWANAAWHFQNSANATHPVGQKAVNAWGLFDMHGNTWEWCADWHGDYPAGDVMDPIGPASGQERILRGGSWFDGPDYCRSAFRFWRSPEMRDINFGFRVALDAP